MARQARAAAAAREQRLDALALREEQAWQHVDSLISSKKPREYDTAVAVLLDLQALAERGSDGNAFDTIQSEDRYRADIRHDGRHGVLKPTLVDADMLGGVSDLNEERLAFAHRARSTHL